MTIKQCARLGPGSNPFGGCVLQASASSTVQVPSLGFQSVGEVNIHTEIRLYSLEYPNHNVTKAHVLFFSVMNLCYSHFG